MKKLFLIFLLLFVSFGLFAEMRYNREFEDDFLRYSYTVRDNKDIYMVWAKEPRSGSFNNFNYFEITTTSEEKAEEFLLLMSECASYEDFINEYAEKHKNLVFIKKTLSVSYENNITVNYYYELR